MKIEQRAVTEIKPYEGNPRKNDQAVDAVARSITEFGWRQPVVIDKDNVIVVGHTRWKAAQKLGLDKVPVHVALDLTPEQARAYRIADNATNTLAEWDLELLPLELVGLKDMNFDLSLLGFPEDELARLLKSQTTDGLCDPDDVPAPPDEATTKRGDIWLLGQHRLMCGDSADPGDVDRLLDGAPIHLCNTDPPYNVKVEPRSNNAIRAGLSSFSESNKKPSTHHQKFDEARQGRKKATTKKLRAKDRPLENDFVSDEAFEKMLRGWFGNMARVMLPGRAIYAWGGYANIANYPPALKDCGFYFSQGIVWDKQHPVLTRKDFMGAFEICFYGWKEGAGHQFYGPNNVPDLWHIKKINPQSMEHLTQKPVELAARAMMYSSQPGENVLDLFGGSGSTLIAAEQLGRVTYLMEIDCLYADLIVDRWQRFTGKVAKHAVTGEPFPTPPPAITEQMR
jgi:DNA modification methylase